MTAEAIVSAICTVTTTTAINGRVADVILLDELAKAMELYH